MQKSFNLLKSNKVTCYKICPCGVRYESFKTKPSHFFKQKFFTSGISEILIRLS